MSHGQSGREDTSKRLPWAEPCLLRMVLLAHRPDLPMI
jgi:hypothetical protein